MSSDEILEKVNEVFREVFDDDSLEIKRETNSEHIEDWDSLNHIQLVVNTERKFGIEFTAEEIQNFKDVGDMCDNIRQKLA